MLMINSLVGFGARRSTNVWSPLSLFASSEQGAWYDPSDLSTMFQDASGTTPVTADGQPVGLILDKSKGLTLGSESCPIFTNSGWDDAGAIPTDWVLSGGILTVTASAQWARIATTLAQDALNKWFVCSIDVQSISGSVGVSAWLGWTGAVSTARSITLTTTGVKKFYFYSNDAAAGIDIQTTSAAASCVINSISVKELAGNHASQATAAARPQYKTDGTYHWLQFDGVDDGLASSSINLSSVNLTTLFSGLFRPNDSGCKMYAEFGPPDTTGGFYFAARSSASGYEAGLKGSAGQTVAISNTASPPVKDVVTVSLDYTQTTNATEIVMRVDSASVSTSQLGATSAGDGPFGNLPLNVGKRSDGSLPMAGNIYALIFRASGSTAPEIADAEAWVNGKTGAY